MKLSHEEVREILSIVKSSDFDTIEIKVGDIEIAASKSGRSRPGPAPVAADLATAPVTQEKPVSATVSPPMAQRPPEKSGNEGLIEITAPIVGTFYVASEPGAPAFVKPGDRVEEDTPVGIIEVMKVFNNVRAEVRGEVVSCLVEDGDFVEFKQPIFLVRPEA